MSSTHSVAAWNAALQEERARGSSREHNAMRGLLARRLGVRVDAGRLEAAEAKELLTLTRKVTAPAGHEAPGVECFSPSRLSKSELARWHDLIGRAAGEPELFIRLDGDRRLIQEMAEKMLRPRPLERAWSEEPGAVTLSGKLFEQLGRPDPKVGIAHLGVLVVVLCSLENGRAVFPGGRVDGDGEDRVLVVGRPGPGLAKFDRGDAVLPAVGRMLEELAAAGWVTVETVSNEWRIGFGRLTRAPGEVKTR